MTQCIAMLSFERNGLWDYIMEFAFLESFTTRMNANGLKSSYGMQFSLLH